MRANIRQLVGGAGEDTILARVGEGIVSSIGSSENHKSVLENPDSISKLVLRKGLDAGTAFEILSIDIADIDIGKNIGAALQIDQANADKNIAQAKAEERRAMAVATEQEMKQRPRKPVPKLSRQKRKYQGHGRSIPQRQSGYHGLLPDEEYRSRHFHARKHCQTDDGQYQPAVEQITRKVTDRNAGTGEQESVPGVSIYKQKIKSSSI